MSISIKLWDRPSAKVGDFEFTFKDEVYYCHSQCCNYTSRYAVFTGIGQTSGVLRVTDIEWNENLGTFTEVDRHADVGFVVNDWHFLTAACMALRDKLSFYPFYWQTMRI